MQSKIKSLAALTGTIRALRSKGRKIIFTNGCFDILHVGHIEYLKKAKELGDILVVAVNSDRSVRMLKGDSRPINSESDRAKILAALFFVDYVTVFDEPTPEKAIIKLSPDILVKGGDWDVKSIAGGDFVKNRGGRVVTIPFIKGYSTTSIVKRISR